MPLTAASLVRLAAYVCLWGLVAHTVADADLWGHLRFGLDMLATGVLPTHDPYSFTSDRLWVNHEWLSELLMAAAYTAGGAFGLNLLKVATTAIIVSVVVAAAKWEKATPIARDALVCLTVISVFMRIMFIRPQLFSIAIFCGVLYCIRQVDRGRLRAVWGIPACFAVWVNLHGGWIVGLAVAGVWFAAAILERRGRTATIALTAAGLATLTATFVNPYGLGLWRFLGDTVGLVRPNVADWYPLLALPPAILIVESVLPIVAIAATATSGERVPLRYVLMLALLVAATLKVGRVDAFTESAIAILLAPQIFAGSARLSTRDITASRVIPPALRTAAATALLIALVATTAQMREIGVGSVTPDKEAIVFLGERARGGRVLTWFNWGEYAVWHLAPAGIRVSLDGRRETVYSDHVVMRHTAFYSGAAGALDYPDRIGADHIWLPADLPVAKVLSDRGWHKVFESRQSVIFARTASPTVQIAEVPIEQRTFPGP